MIEQLIINAINVSSLGKESLNNYLKRRLIIAFELEGNKNYLSFATTYASRTNARNFQCIKTIKVNF